MTLEYQYLRYSGCNVYRWTYTDELVDLVKLRCACAFCVKKKGVLWPLATSTMNEHNWCRTGHNAIGQQTTWGASSKEYGSLALAQRPLKKANPGQTFPYSWINDQTPKYIIVRECFNGFTAARSICHVQFRTLSSTRYCLRNQI